jgi:hypothetical protein
MGGASVFWAVANAKPDMMDQTADKACAQYCALVTEIMKMVNAVASLAGKAWSAS